MNESIRIDPSTGQKVFNTRAAKLTEKIDGKGYSEIEDKTLTTLPPPPPATGCRQYISLVPPGLSRLCDPIDS